MTYGLFNVTKNKWVGDADKGDGRDNYTSHNREEAEDAAFRVREFCKLNPDNRADVIEVREYRHFSPTPERRRMSLDEIQREIATWDEESLRRLLGHLAGLLKDGDDMEPLPSLHS